MLNIRKKNRRRIANGRKKKRRSTVNVDNKR
jgi:hypothetical protein